MRWKLYDQDVLQVAPVAAPSNSAPATWNLQAIDLPLAQQQSSARGDGVTVAIIDSGIDYNHSDLYQAFDRQNVGWDFFSFDNKPFDDNSHGTAIAGIIASQGSSQAPAGIAPRAKLLAFKAIDPYGQTSSAALYGAAQRAIASGARILVLAWDSGLDSRALQGIVALAEASNVLVVTAVGDQGRDLREFARFPAAHSNRSPNIINVAALGKTGTLSKLYGRNSNFGDGLVDIAAPGESINTLAPRSLYLNRSGSDLAAAHVAGVAALLLSARPNLTGSDLKNALIQGGNQNPLLNGLVTNARMLSTPGSLHAISN
jgi:subtilisin family serine protease